MATKLTDEQIQELKAAFEIFDKDNNGRISNEELGAVMRSLGQNPTNRELFKMLSKVDKNDSGYVEWSEFITFMEDVPNQVDQTEEIRAAFELFDKDKSGFIEVEELRRLMLNMGERLSDAEVKDLLDKADIDKDGRINYKEFALLMTAK